MIARNGLKPYMGFSGDDPGEGACLIFAESVKAARRHAHGILTDWWDSHEWLDTRVRLLKHDLDYLFSLGVPEKLAAGVPHVVESPPVCRRCEIWGYPPAEVPGDPAPGGCQWCVDDEY